MQVAQVSLGLRILHKPSTIEKWQILLNFVKRKSFYLVLSNPSVTDVSTKHVL